VARKGNVFLFATERGKGSFFVHAERYKENYEFSSILREGEKKTR
jgi:hypothetical protein